MALANSFMYADCAPAFYRVEEKPARGSRNGMSDEELGLILRGYGVNASPNDFCSGVYRAMLEVPVRGVIRVVRTFANDAGGDQVSSTRLAKDLGTAEGTVSRWRNDDDALAATRLETVVRLLALLGTHFWNVEMPDFQGLVPEALRAGITWVRDEFEPGAAPLGEAELAAVSEGRFEQLAAGSADRCRDALLVVLCAVVRNEGLYPRVHQETTEWMLDDDRLDELKDLLRQLAATRPRRQAKSGRGKNA
jgi:hypothetical protein